MTGKEEKGMEIGLLREISTKLSQLILLSKIANKEELDKQKAEWKEKSDQLDQAIRDAASQGLLSGAIKEKVCKDTGKSTRTVENRLYRMIELGILVPRREGRNVYYDESGLFD